MITTNAVVKTHPVTPSLGGGWGEAFLLILMQHFTLDELTYSLTAVAHCIDNTPPAAALANLNYLVDTLLDPLRNAFGAPIIVQSGYRNADVNRLVDGVRTSAHVQGLAADISAVGQNRQENARLVRLLLTLELPFDQLIQYDVNALGPRWLHLGLQRDPRRNRYAQLRR